VAGHEKALAGAESIEVVVGHRHRGDDIDLDLREADLYDLFRLIEVFDATGELAVAVTHAPGGIARIIADVVQRAILADSVRARNQMALTPDRPLDVDHIIAIFATFVEGLSPQRGEPAMRFGYGQWPRPPTARCSTSGRRE